MAWQSMKMILALIFLSLELRSSEGLGECQSSTLELAYSYVRLHCPMHACKKRIVINDLSRG